MKKRFVKSAKVFPASITSTNWIQKYPHITESYACILKIFVVIFSLPISFEFVLECKQHQNYENK